MKKRGGARPNAGRKKGIGLSYDIQKYCNNFMEEMLKNEAVKLKATKQLALKLNEIDTKYLYLIKNKNLYKIGYSSNLKKRLKDYDVHLGKYELIYLLEDSKCFEIEQELHNIFRDKRETGEWFNLTNDDVIKIISYCTNKIKL